MTGGQMPSTLASSEKLELCPALKWPQGRDPAKGRASSQLVAGRCTHRCVAGNHVGCEHERECEGESSPLGAGGNHNPRGIKRQKPWAKWYHPQSRGGQPFLAAPPSVPSCQGTQLC